MGAPEFPSIALHGSFRWACEYLEGYTGAPIPFRFAAWWALLGAALGSRPYGTWSGRMIPQPYGLLIGPTGTHKSTAVDALLDLAPKEVTLCDGMTTEVGLFDQLEASFPVLVNIDELGFLMEAMRLPGTSLEAMLTTAWNGLPD